MSGMAAAFRTALHQEPVVIWSCMIGGVGERAVWRLRIDIHQLQKPFALPGVDSSQHAVSDVQCSKLAPGLQQTQAPQCSCTGIRAAFHHSLPCECRHCTAHHCATHQGILLKA